jgi:CxxC motif-containing protein (DUF1111 family)
MARSVNRGHFLLAFGLLLGCSGGNGLVEEPSSDEVPDSIFGQLGEPVPFATSEQLETFERGREVAIRRFTPETGLGPHFNVVSCTACHERPLVGGSAGRYRNFLIVGQELSDGSFTPTGVEGIQPQFTLEERGREYDDEDTNVEALRNPIPFFGVGLIAELTEESILANADPDDEDGDGISGRPNYDEGFVGRFGRKSQTVSIEGFIRGPLFNHLGITSDPLSDKRKNQLPVPSGLSQPDPELMSAGLGRVQLAQAAAPSEPTVDDDGVDDPELAPQDLFDLVSFSMLLAAPRPDEPTEETERGGELFEEIGCVECHVRGLSSRRGLIPLYSDLLLHDMGKDRADGVRMKDATGSEFRTQPLWGVSAVGPYLHDGAADTLDEAIRLHGGEGRRARNAYVDLPKGERKLVIAFLESLGGRSQHSPGLLEPRAAVPAVGDFGGPSFELDDTELELFLSGRDVFDRDMGLDVGLGPTFNGDSCRACHFDPVIGGSGPSDVDVTRQCIIDDDGNFVEPPSGTMLHHQDVRSTRPQADDECNCFELRQTPPIFGLGLLERVPVETILALQDPDDEDGDGVRGVAAILEDGRLGRLGWKANVPDLAEFARDGLTNELGVTVADQQGLSFGASSDADEIEDPEIDVDEIEALVYFMQQLAPPPRDRHDRGAEDRGEQLFSDVGCATCHVPRLETVDGQAVNAYTNLLLHEVLPKGAPGVATREASQRAFRTAPLWGLSKTAPYMHDGRAFTIEAAIMAHAGEAKASRNAFDGLTSGEREDVLAFLNSL